MANYVSCGEHNGAVYGGAEITQAAGTGEHRLSLSTGSTIQDCAIGFVQLSTVPPHDSVSPEGIVIQNNTFSTTASSTIEFSSGATNFLIEGNTNVNYLVLPSSTHGIVRNNTFYGNYAGYGHGVMMDMANDSADIQITGNTFTNYSHVRGGSMALVSLNGFGISFATNTIRYAVDFPSMSDVQTSLETNASGTVYIGGNRIDSPNSDNCTGISIHSLNDSPWTGTYVIQHNTIRRRPLCSNGSVIGYSTASNRPDVSIDFAIQYNLFYNASTTADTAPALRFQRDPLTSLTQTNSNNGFYNFGGRKINSQVSGGEGGDPDLADDSSITRDPYLELGDVSTANDLDVAPFSSYLDAVGSLDIGATSGARRTVIFIDATGPIDYTTHDLTTTDGINAYIRSGDTVMIGSGVYHPFSINSASATSSITIMGAGDSTIINAGAGADGILFSNVSSSHIQDLRVRNASGASASSYTMTDILARFGGTDYNEEFGMLGIGASQSVIFTDSSQCDAGPPSVVVTTDGVSVTSAIRESTTAFHLAAIRLMGAHITVLLPNDQFANQTALENYLNSVCGLPGAMFMIDAFADNLFTASGGNFTYDSGSLLSSGMTLVSGVTDPPAITLATGVAFAGIHFTGSSNYNTVSRVSSINNGIGVRFASTGDSFNTVSDSSFSGSTYYDVLSGGNAMNTFDNTAFTPASSSVSGVGSLTVKYRARVQVVDADGGAPLTGITASSTDAALTATSFGATGGGGYTGYLRLPAYIISASSHEVTTGGYNPYRVRTTAIAGYSASSTPSFTLDSPDQLVSIAAVRTAPAAPSGITASSITTSTVDVAWDDNAANNSATIFDYAYETAGETFPTAGVTELSEDSIGTHLVGLHPNGGYRFRVAARNAGGTSVYDTSDLYYLLAATPATPVVSPVSQTAVSVAVPADENSTSTEYAIYSSTLGGYLSPAGTASPVVTWQTSSTWSTLTVSGLTCGTSYSFTTVARNHDGIQSATSTAAAATTSACSVVSSGGGGGGGGGAIGGNSGGSSAIQTFFSDPASQVVPQSTASSTSTSTTSTTGNLPGSSSTTTSNTTPESTLEQFLREGTTPASRALGRGEREAVLRDMQEILSVPAERILVSDLELLSGGQIPRTRSLAYERTMAPRALATFRAIFGHAPNFRNATENLAWNTLMYRIRFVRDVRAERQGILSFRRTFGVSPRTPFQWATVRVFAYLVK